MWNRFPCALASLLVALTSLNAEAQEPAAASLPCDWDLDALEVCTEPQRESALRFLNAAAHSVAQLPGARSATRSRDLLLNARGGPDYDGAAASAAGHYPGAPAATRPAGDEPLPLLVLPPAAHAATLLADHSASLTAPEASGRPHARTLHFTPFASDGRHGLPCAVPQHAAQGPARNPMLKAWVDVAQQGKATSTVPGLAGFERVRAKAGSKVQGTITTLALAPRFYLSRVEHGGLTTDTWAVPIADANGAAHWTDGPSVKPTRGSLYENRLTAPPTAGTLGRHSLLVHPRPLPVDYAEQDLFQRPRSTWADYQVQERVVITAELAAAHPALVLRAASTWQPYSEDVVLEPLGDGGLPENTRLLAVALDAPTATWLQALGAYYGVDALTPAQAAGWLAELDALR